MRRVRACAGAGRSGGRPPPPRGRAAPPRTALARAPRCSPNRELDPLRQQLRAQTLGPALRPVDLQYGLALVHRCTARRRCPSHRPVRPQAPGSSTRRRGRGASRRGPRAWSAMSRPAGGAVRWAQAPRPVTSPASSRSRCRCRHHRPARAPRRPEPAGRCGRAHSDRPTHRPGTRCSARSPTPARAVAQRQQRAGAETRPDSPSAALDQLGHRRVRAGARRPSTYPPPAAMRRPAATRQRHRRARPRRVHVVETLSWRCGERQSWYPAPRGCRARRSRRRPTAPRQTRLRDIYLVKHGLQGGRPQRPLKTESRSRRCGPRTRHHRCRHRPHRARTRPRPVPAEPLDPCPCSTPAPEVP